MYHGDAKETISPAPWLVPLPSLRRGIPAHQRQPALTARRARKEGRKQEVLIPRVAPRDYSAEDPCNGGGSNRPMPRGTRLVSASDGGG